jgi:hypothetical protein
VSVPLCPSVQDRAKVTEPALSVVLPVFIVTVLVSPPVIDPISADLPVCWSLTVTSMDVEELRGSVLVNDADMSAPLPLLAQAELADWVVSQRIDSAFCLRLCWLCNSISVRGMTIIASTAIEMVINLGDVSSCFTSINGKRNPFLKDKLINEACQDF